MNTAALPRVSPLKRLSDFIFGPLDKWLLLTLLVIYITSLFLLYSADGQDFGQLENKTVHTVIGFAAMWFIAKIRPQRLGDLSPLFYIGSLLMLLGVHFFGITVNGSTRWLNLGIVRLQPSEFMKIALPMLVAWFFQKYDTDRRWYHYLLAFFLILLPVGLILKQPDLGTSILIMASGIFVIFFAGLPWRVILGLFAAAAAALPLMWEYGMKPYQKQRVMTLLDPTQDPLGSGYHIIQSTIAIGSGGVWGKGWLNGTQAHLDYIPERTTDFIFAVFGEEFGLVGCALLLIVFGILIGRGLWIAAHAANLYGRLLAAALTMILFCYAFVNMGMVSGILPVVGVPLPLVSYGGTATLSIMVIIGLLMGISAHSNK